MPTEQEIRERIVAVASREVNLIFANKNVGEGPGIKPARWGGRRLTVFFDEAAPVYKRANPKFNEFLIGPANHGRGLPAWCGIFALYAIRTAYQELGETAPVGTWHAGQSIPGAGGVFQIPSGVMPKVGDVGIEQNEILRPNGEKLTGWHHFIVASDPVAVAGKITFDSVEGNAGNDGATVSRRPKELRNGRPAIGPYSSALTKSPSVKSSRAAGK